MWPLKNQTKVLSNADILKVIETEQVFAKQFDCGISSPPSNIADKDKPLEQWIALMEGYLYEAKLDATVRFKPDQALEKLRIVLSLGFNAARYHGLPERQQFKAGFVRRNHSDCEF